MIKRKHKLRNIYKRLNSSTKNMNLAAKNYRCVGYISLQNYTMYLLITF